MGVMIKETVAEAGEEGRVVMLHLFYLIRKESFTLQKFNPNMNAVLIIC